MLQSATQLSMSQPKDDEEMIDYNNALRNGIFEAYAGMLQGFKEDKSKIALLMQHAEFVWRSWRRCTRTPTATRRSRGRWWA